MKFKKYILNFLRPLLNRMGYDIVKFKTTYPAQIVSTILGKNEISVVLDIGANTGQYGQELRKAGFKGRIISFEPLSDAFNELQVRAKNEKKWAVYQYALGEKEEEGLIHVSGHLPSSSLLPMTDLHIETVPGSAYFREEKIIIRPLDAVFNQLNVKGEKIFMKVDTQGYEKNVLDGAANSLPLITGLQLELSATMLYEGEELYYKVCEFVENRGFRLIKIIPGYSDKSTGEMLQFDAIFLRKG